MRESHTATEEACLPSGLKFKHPFTCTIVGGTQSGKTTLVLDLLKNRKSTIEGELKHFYWALPEEAAVPHAVLHHDPPFHIIRGPPTPSDLQQDSFVVIDDLGTRCMGNRSESENIAKLFTVTSHHSRVSIILILHNQFPKGPFSREIALSCGYNILTKNPRCPQTFRHLAQQLVGQGVNSLYSCYCEATESPYSYFLVDNTQSCPPALRFRTRVIPREHTNTDFGIEIFSTPDQVNRLTRLEDSPYEYFTESE